MGAALDTTRRVQRSLLDRLLLRHHRHLLALDALAARFLLRRERAPAVDVAALRARRALGDRERGVHDDALARVVALVLAFDVIIAAAFWLRNLDVLRTYVRSCHFLW